MLKAITISDYLTNFSSVPIIDVRSPGEFLKGHIPNAINIPLFSDEERAEVGTVYKRKSKEKAIALGLQFVEPKLESFISDAQEVAKNNEIVVHCWRGGMRSQSFADHLHKNGFEKVYYIENGYKAFRNHVLDFFGQPFKLRVVGGYTGSGKTELLHVLRSNNHQVIDLEGIANHKGSAFGAIGQNKQPTTEHFENCLFSQLNSLDLNEVIWIEDESISIGRVFIPKVFFDQIRSNLLYFIDIPMEERAKFLVQNYGVHDIESLKASLLKIQKRLGPQHVKSGINALDNGDLLYVAKITLVYYDKAYANGLTLRVQDKITKVPMQTVNHEKNANTLLDFQQEIKN